MSIVGHLFKKLFFSFNYKQPRHQPPHKSGRMRTDFLFAPPSFLSGMGSILDLSGNLDWYNYSRTGKEADWKALYSDYRMIGQDIEDAMRAYERAHAELQRSQARLFNPDKTREAS